MTQRNTFDYRLFFSLLLLTFVPTIYETLRVFFISSIPSTQAFSISGQMEWFDLIDETLRALLIVPLYYILNQTVEDKDKFKERILGTGIFVFVIYFLFSVFVYFYASSLVSAMTIPSQEIEEITDYIRLETISFSIAIISNYFFVIFVLIGKHSYFYTLLVTKTIFMMIGDSFFIPHFGVNGIAYSNMITYTLVASISFFMLKKENLLSFRLGKHIFSSWLKLWSKIGAFSGGQILLDNLIYAIMIVKLINEVADQGTYWVANGFIWGWLLVPIISLSEIIKKECKNGFSTHHMKKYFKINIIICIVWLCSIPLWNYVFNDLMHLPNAGDVFAIVSKLLPFYMVYTFSSTLDSMFIGIGKTNYLFFNSLFINIVYYGTLFLLFHSGIFVPDMNFIIIMFGCGMILHFIISAMFAKAFLFKKQLQK